MKKVVRKSSRRQLRGNSLFHEHEKLARLQEIQESDLELGPAYNSPLELSDPTNMFDRFVLRQWNIFE